MSANFPIQKNPYFVNLKTINKIETYLVLNIQEIILLNSQHSSNTLKLIIQFLTHSSPKLFTSLPALSTNS